MPVPDGSTCCVDLKVDHSLLDPHFDGYKLSLDPLPVYRIQIDGEVDVTCLTNQQYSYQHAKAFGSPNLLYLDPWWPDTVYMIDSHWRILQYATPMDGAAGQLITSWQIPNAVTERGVEGRVAVTLAFPTAQSMVLADGTGHFYILSTGNRDDDIPWKIEYSSAVLGDDIPFTLLNVTSHMDGSQQHLECLMLHIEADIGKSKLAETAKQQIESQGESSEVNSQSESSEAGDQTQLGASGMSQGSSLTSQFTTVLEWLSFSRKDGGEWLLERTRRLHGLSAPDYAAVEAGGSAVLLASEKMFTIIYDSMNPVEEMEEEDTEAPPAYTWSQTTEDVTIQFTLPPAVVCGDIHYQLSNCQLKVGLRGGATLLEGSLGGGVDTSASTWTLNAGGNILEVYLSKSNDAVWPLAVEGDKRGQMVVDPQEAAIIHERLAHLTSESWNANPAESARQAYNSQQLEDCDLMGGGDAMLLRIDGERHHCSHKVCLGSRQWLLTMPPGSTTLPTLCLRHDVDGLLWQPSSDRPGNQAPWKHVATLKAYGYVQASKQQRRFSLCAPDFSYGVVCDSVRHVYIYRQNTPVTTELRNRRTGQQVASVCKQQLLSLDSPAPILGAQCTSQRLFLLLSKQLCVITIATSE